MRKRVRVREAVGAGVGSIAKMTVELQQPTAVMQQQPSPSSFSCPTAPMQEPTQNIQNEQMDSPMEMGAQEHREQRKVRLSETLSSEMSKRLVVKAKPTRPSMIAPMMESFGLIDLLDTAPSSKDETTASSLHAIDGIDVVTALVPEEDVWQFEVTKTCAREIQFQDREQESVAIVDRQDPNVSKTINVCEARMGEKLDTKEIWKTKTKEVLDFDEFQVKVKVVKSEIRMTPGKKVWSKLTTHYGTQCDFDGPSHLYNGSECAPLNFVMASAAFRLCGHHRSRHVVSMESLSSEIGASTLGAGTTASRI